MASRVILFFSLLVACRQPKVACKCIGCGWSGGRIVRRQEPEQVRRLAHERRQIARVTDRKCWVTCGGILAQKGEDLHQQRAKHLR